MTELDQIKQELKRLEEEFDPHYRRSDDHKVWAKHRDIEAMIRQLKQHIQEVEQ